MRVIKPVTVARVHVMPMKPSPFARRERRRCCDGKDDLHPGVLFFKTLQTEVEYHQQPDTTFPHYLACATTIFAFLSAIQFTLMPR